jgi:hypothetical protein
MPEYLEQMPLSSSSCTVVLREGLEQMLVPVKTIKAEFGTNAALPKTEAMPAPRLVEVFRFLKNVLRKKQKQFSRLRRTPA